MNPERRPEPAGRELLADLDEWIRDQGRWQPSPTMALMTTIRRELERLYSLDDLLALLDLNALVEEAIRRQR